MTCRGDFSGLTRGDENNYNGVTVQLRQSLEEGCRKSEAGNVFTAEFDLFKN